MVGCMCFIYSLYLEISWVRFISGITFPEIFREFLSCVDGYVCFIYSDFAFGVVVWLFLLLFL